jgi:predicted RND superfamily exporter protein
MTRFLPSDRAMRSTLIFAFGFVLALVVLSYRGIFLIYFPLLGIGISAAYFFAPPKGGSLERRLATSAHGLSITALYFAFGLFPLPGCEIPWPAQGEPHWSAKNVAMIEGTFNLMCLLCVALIVISFIFFRGPKKLHLLQLLNFLLLAWTWVLGTFAISGATL